MGTWDVGPFDNDQAADWCGDLHDAEPSQRIEGGTIEVPDDFRALAVRALDRITGDDSEWRALWEESGSYASALAVLDQIRVNLDTRL